MNPSAAEVLKLRDETDYPMMDCKRALYEAKGDHEKAKEYLRSHRSSYAVLITRSRNAD